MGYQRTTRAAHLLALILICRYAAGQDAHLANTVSSQTAAPDLSQTQIFVLKEGTEVPLKFAQKLSAKSAFVGEPVELVLAQDLKVGDVTVVKQGARVLGTVVAGKESEKKKQEAHQLAMRVDFLKVGNTKIKLRGEKAAEGKRNKNAMIEGTVFLGLSGLLMTSGKHYEIPEGSAVTAYVNEDVELAAVNP